MRKFFWPTLIPPALGGIGWDSFRRDGAPHLPASGRCGWSALRILSLLLVFAALAFTQDIDNLGLARPQPQRVTLAPVAPVALRAGSSAQVELDFRVSPGFHINSNKPISDVLVPTVIKLNPPTDISIAKVTYPAGHDLTFAFAPNEKLSVYTGDFSVGALVRAARSMPPGRFRVHGDLRYQACDNKACYPPTRVPVAFDLKISKAAATPRTRRNPRQSPHVHQ